MDKILVEFKTVNRDNAYIYTFITGLNSCIDLFQYNIIIVRLQPSPIRKFT